MEIVTKQATAAVAPVEDEHPNGSFEVILSTESLDRDKENLWADEWKQPLPEKIHFDGDHGRSLDKTVGSAVPCFEGNKLVAKGTFAGTPYAQMVRQLVNEGHVNSVSVTFAERKFQKSGDAAVNPTGVERELLNAAFVAIPANPEAIVLSSKSAKAAQVGAMDSPTLADLVAKAAGGMSASGDNPTVKHDEMVQAMHDAAVHLGAQCLNEIDADPGTADGANKSVQFVFDTYGSKEFTDWDQAATWLKRAAYARPETELKIVTKTSSTEEAGTPQETEESTAATADKAAAAADESADDAATKADTTAKVRALAFLIKQNTPQEG